MRNHVLVLFCCKGGAGATAIACNVAHHAAKHGHKTCMLDLDLQFGDDLAALGLQAGLTIAQVMPESQKGTAFPASSLPRHASGVSVLSQVGSLDDLDKINAEGLGQVVESLRTSFDVLVVDGVRDFSDNVLAVLDMADTIALITLQEVLAIRRARGAFAILRKLGFDPADINVVVNRFSPESDIPYTTLQEVFKPARVLVVPKDYSLVVQSLNRGVPLLDIDANNPVTRNISRVADGLLGADVDTTPDLAPKEAPKKESLLQKLGLAKK